MIPPTLEVHKQTSDIDLFSHDSTHVRLVIEAEKQSDLARSKAREILQKYSKDYNEDGEKKNEETGMEENRDDGFQSTIEKYSQSPYINCINQYSPEEDEEAKRDENEGVFDKGELEDLTDDDVAQIARFLQPLSPKGLRRNKAKKVSGQFEFKRINNGAISVVKSNRKLEIITNPDDILEHAEAFAASKKNTKKNKKGGFSPKKGKKGGLRRRFSFSSRSRGGTTDSGIYTDDACLKISSSQSQTEAYINSMNDKSPTTAVAAAAVNPLNKEVKTGDLPPIPTKKKPAERRFSIVAPSSVATASDVDGEEIISVVSNISDISEVSVAEKYKNRGPTVLTKAMLEQAVIPDTICLKYKKKQTKMQSLGLKMKRKLSFGKRQI